MYNAWLVLVTKNSIYMNYQLEIKNLVDAGKLHVTCVIGPPRSGTTALERSLYERFAYTGQINHPGLGSDHEDASWKEVYESAQSAIKQHGEPAYLLVKNTSHYIHPGRDLQQWMEVCDGFVVCIRNPLLQIESLAGLIADKISVGGIDSVVDRESAPRTTYHGQPLLADGIGESVSWNDWTRGLKDRHYSCRDLAPQFGACMFNEKTYANPEFLEWLFKQHIKEERLQVGEVPPTDGFVNWDADRFFQLPQVYKNALLDWRLGWTGIREYVKDFDLKKKPFTILDFSGFQADPTHILLQVTDFLIDNGCVPASSAPTLRRKGFDFGIAQSSYASIAFKTAQENPTILPPSKKPLSVDAFPDFLIPGLDRAMKVYRALCDHKNICLTSLSALEQLLSIDPVTVACLQPDRKIALPEKYKLTFNDATLRK